MSLQRVACTCHAWGHLLRRGQGTPASAIWGSAWLTVPMFGEDELGRPCVTLTAADALRRAPPGERVRLRAGTTITEEVNVLQPVLLLAEENVTMKGKLVLQGGSFSPGGRRGVVRGLKLCHFMLEVCGTLSLAPFPNPYPQPQPSPPTPILTPNPNPHPQPQSSPPTLTPTPTPTPTLTLTPTLTPTLTLTLTLSLPVTPTFTPTLLTHPHHSPCPPPLALPLTRRSMSSAATGHWRTVRSTRASAVAPRAPSSWARPQPLTCAAAGCVTVCMLSCSSAALPRCKPPADHHPNPNP